MPEIQSTRDAILLGIPMLGLLVLNFFRLDYLLGHKRKPTSGVELGHPLSQTVESDQLLWVEPDGELRGSEAGRAQRVPRTKLLKRSVTAYWAEKDCWE
jgi:hypothetical protein